LFSQFDTENILRTVLGAEEWIQVTSDMSSWNI